MERIKQTEMNIWRLSDVLRSVMYVRDIPYIITRLVFLKYVIDNYVGASNMEEMQQCAKAQKMLAMRDVENGLDAIIPVLRYIDKTYGLEDILSSNENIAEYEVALFGVNRATKKNVTSRDFRNVIEVLAELDLAEDDNANLGVELVRILIGLILNDISKSSVRYGSTTSTQLADIAKGILSVDDDDTFCDFLSGVGTSTIRIIDNNMTRVVSADVDVSMASISAMLFIMRGFKNFSTYCCNTLLDINEGIKGNKIFVDPPLMGRIKDGNSEEYSDVSLRVIDRIVKYYLEEKGVAVIAVPSGVLFGSGPAKKLKKELIDNNYIKGIISLPPMWEGTVVGTNLIVISKEQNEKIIFMDAFSDRKSSRRKSGVLSSSEIEKIVNVFNNPIDETGFSKVVSKEAVNGNEYNLIPRTYVKDDIKEEIVSVEEIDQELEKLYASLKG